MPFFLKNIRLSMQNTKKNITVCILFYVFYVPVFSIQSQQNQDKKTAEKTSSKKTQDDSTKPVKTIIGKKTAKNPKISATEGLEKNTSNEISNYMPQEKEHPLLKRAEDHFFHKRYNIALKLLKIILNESPENIMAYLYAGDIYLIQHNFGLAEEQFSIAKELSKNPAREYFRLGQTRFLRKNKEGALAAFQKSLKAHPEMHINHFYIGMVYYHLFRDKEKTIKAWTIFRERQPNDPQGPKIDQALKLLKSPGFQFPAIQSDPCIGIPENKDSRALYKPGENEKEKSNNKTESIQEVDEL